MPVQYKIQANLIEFKLSGAFTIEELEGVCYRAILNPVFKSPMKAIIDTSQASTDSTPSEIKKQAAVLRSIKTHLSPKWASVARPGSLNFGLARIFAAHIARDDIETCVFADRHQACGWLFEKDKAGKKRNHCEFPPLSEFKGWQPYP